MSGKTCKSQLHPKDTRVTMTQLRKLVYADGYTELGMQDRIRMVAIPKKEVPFELELDALYGEE